ncbi:MAG: glutamate-1-semialdehyde 2,1-aminomutase [Limnochordales bacterium]
MGRWSGSLRLYEEAAEHLAGGVSTAFRRGTHPAPVYAQRAQGARLIDVDGNEYIDYMMAYGPLIHGHAHPAIVEALTRQAPLGTTYGVQHQGEVELARRLTRYVPCADLVCFVNSGTEANLVALRVARAYTGRQKIIRFNGHYHGWADPLLVKPAAELQGLAPQAATGGQSAAAFHDLIVLPWNDPGALEQALAEQGDQVAAIIMEPVLCNNGCLMPLPGYLERVRELADAHGVVLIFDEVITGFRVALGGAQELFGVTPDLCVLGKAIAGGLPLSAVAGRREIMQLVADGTVSHMGTLNGNPLVTAAAIATIDLLAADGGAAYQRMNARTDALTEGLKELAAKHGVPLLIHRVGPVFHTLFTDRSAVSRYEEFAQCVDQAAYRRFSDELFRHGVLVRPSGLWYVSTAHEEADIEATLAAADRAFAAVK